MALTPVMVGKLEGGGEGEAEGGGGGRGGGLGVGEGEGEGEGCWAAAGEGEDAELLGRHWEYQGLLYVQAEPTQHEVGPVHPIPAHWDQSEPHCAAAAAAELLKARSRGSAC